MSFSAEPIRPTPLHALEEAPLTLQDTRSTFDSVEAAVPESNESKSQLPVKGEAGDAQAALDKLDRLQKSRQAKRNWRKGTGISYAAHLLKPHRNKGENDDDADSSSENEQQKARDEVKLMITGNPLVGRVISVASKAKGRLRGTGESPEVSPQNEHGSLRYPSARPGSSIRRKFGNSATSPPPPEVPLSASVSFSPPQLPDVFHQSPPDRSEPFERPKSRGLSAKPELLVVDEEGQTRGAPDSYDTAQHRKARGLSTHNSSASQHSGSYASTPSQSPNTELLANPLTSHSSISSYTGGPIHDEPEAHGKASMNSRRLHSASPSSLSAESSGEQEHDSATTSESENGESGGAIRKASLSLQHGDDVTKEHIKRRKKLLQKEIKRRKAQGEPFDDLEQAIVPEKDTQLRHKTSTRVSRGIHYASGQSRNRRAIERYSPHPGLASLQTTNLGRGTPPPLSGFERSSTPTMTPSASRNQYTWGSRRDSVASSRRSSFTGIEPSSPYNEDNESSFLRRFNTADRSMLSSKNSISKYLHAPGVIKRHRQKKWEAEMAALERSTAAEAEKHDAEAELDRLLGKLAQEQSNGEASKVKYEFDVLYENQRGLLVFGITKFSPRTLFQWDPSPWTSMSNKKSPYNIANAQLPDPSWEWVYPEWFIDMTADTDEAGWQYSGNFGRRFWPNIHFPHGKVGLPKTGAEGLLEKDSRHAEKQEKRQEKESKKEDDGFEALKRSARARKNKWTGSPDPFTFVRRRRWVRLRRRKPLVGHATNAHETTPSHSRIGSPITEKVSNEQSLHNLDPTKVKPGQSDAESSLANSDESDTTSSEDDPYLYAPAQARASSFLARRLPGHLSNGPNPMKSTDAVENERARRHAKQFTGTIRELKSLLPSIIAMDRDARISRAGTGLSASQSSLKWACLKLKTVDARNPFISWRFVKSRLQDDDMAFASSTLRGMERKYQQRRLTATQAAQESQPANKHRRIPSGLISNFGMPLATSGPPPPHRSESKSTSLPTVESISSLSANDLFKSALLDGNELTREALVEINFARVLRVLKACKIDRQRLDLWKLWLGTESLDSMLSMTRIDDLSHFGIVSPPGEDHDTGLPGMEEDAAADAMMNAQFSGGSSLRYRQRAEKANAKWRSSVVTPDPSDVWDVLERKLDDVLLLFEFQSDRAKLIKLLLSVHEQLHPEHVFRDKGARANPLELSPAHIHGDVAEMGTGGAFGSRRPAWQKAGVPRLEFFADLQAILSALPGNDAANEADYIAKKPPAILDELNSVAMPMGYHTQQHHHPQQQQQPRSYIANSLIEQLEAQAQSDACLGELAQSDKRNEQENAEIKAPSLPLPYRKSEPSPAPTEPEAVTSPTTEAPRSILTPPPSHRPKAAPSPIQTNGFCPSNHVTFSCSLSPTTTPKAELSTSPSANLAVPSFRRHAQASPSRRGPTIPIRSNSFLSTSP